MTATTTGRVTVFDWTVPQGSLRKLRIPVYDDDGALYSVNGWTVDAKVKNRPGGDVLHTWAVGDVLASGTYVTLTILPATSTAWTFERGWFRCKVVHPSDATQIFRIVEGAFRLSRD